MKLRMLIISLCGLVAMGRSAAALELGERAPMADVKMKNASAGKDEGGPTPRQSGYGHAGGQLSIADAKGPKGTLVIFSCNHCPFVKGWETRIAELGNTWRKNGVGVIAVNSNDPAAYAEDGFTEMQQRAKQRGFEFPYVVDATSEVGRAFGATRTPEAFLFDKDGKLAYHGTIDDNYQDASKVKDHYLRDALEALVGGKEIPVRETKAIGCSIKFRAKS